MTRQPSDYDRCFYAYKRRPVGGAEYLRPCDRPRYQHEPSDPDYINAHTFTEAPAAEVGETVAYTIGSCESPGCLCVEQPAPAGQWCYVSKMPCEPNAEYPHVCMRHQEAISTYTPPPTLRGVIAEMDAMLAAEPEDEYERGHRNAYRDLRDRLASLTQGPVCDQSSEPCKPWPGNSEVCIVHVGEGGKIGRFPQEKTEVQHDD